VLIIGIHLPIHPLPQFEEDLSQYLKEKEDREAYDRLNAPSTIVVRFGYLRMVGEFPYKGDSKPGCGSKLVVKTHRGTEIGEMLTSTCKNSGCSKSVTRKEMLEYIENSGGRQYPFHDRGEVLRIATVDDLNELSRIEQRKNELRIIAKRMVEQEGLAMTIIEAEPMFGQERVVFYFGAEDRVDFRDLVSDLQKEVGTKVELRQIGARDEARITADYERCGQYCCCKNFLKVLKPVSMKSAKIQKATLDPLKISGRCGRLMCCLRYEDETYDQLRKNLPHRKSRVGSPEGDGIVISTQILTQLALIRLDNGTDVAIPIEELTEPESKTAPEPGSRSVRSGRDGRAGRDADRQSSGRDRSSRRRSGSGSGSGAGEGSSATKPDARASETKQSEHQKTGAESSVETGDRPKKKRRRRRRSGSKGGNNPNQNGTQDQPDSGSGSGPGSGSESGQGQDQTQSHEASSGGDGTGPKKKKKRRRRRRRPGGGEGGAENGSAGGSGGSGGSDGPSDSQ
jgi:cell fate regulator YaaT (PSP1 superfamily)